ncbi:hypothetical protein HDU93_008092 [Gonapodya sp. JEL0774]|nr:hypothetical protein HDU93_008092 [Gonapodya sp. JEL0774]
MKEFNAHSRSAGAGDRGTDTAQEQVTLFTTVQMYLRDGVARLRDEVERSKRGGYAYGVKVVRGAYMVSERERAGELGIPDPIHATIEDTHRAYDEAVEMVLREYSRGRTDLSLIIATHNSHSIVKAMDLMHDVGLEPGSGVVNFAQLYGMMDIHTLTLAQLGYRAHKYVPYGPVDVCVPYLLRRAQENAAVLGGGGKREMEVIGREVGRRWGWGAGV